jgi:hypothetical protein
MQAYLLLGQVSVICILLYCVVIHYHVNAYFKEITEEMYYEINSEENLFIYFFFFWRV